MKRVIETDEAPAAVGAYSQATTNGSLLYTAGQIPLTPDGELLDDEDIATQTTQSLDNVMAILAVLLGLGIDASFGVVAAVAVASGVAVASVTYVIEPRLERKGRA